MPSLVNLSKLENQEPNCSGTSGTLPGFPKQKCVPMLHSTNKINPKLGSISTDAVLTLQNALHMQQFQRFQEALALGSLFAGMLERWPRFLNAQPHIQSKSKELFDIQPSSGLAEQIWKSQQRVFTCHLFHGLATFLPITRGFPQMCYVCRWLNSTQMEVSRFPSEGLQEEWQVEGYHNSLQPLPPASVKETRAQAV